MFLFLLHWDSGNFSIAAVVIVDELFFLPVCWFFIAFAYCCEWFSTTYMSYVMSFLFHIFSNYSRANFHFCSLHIVSCHMMMLNVEFSVSIVILQCQWDKIKDSTKQEHKQFNRITTSILFYHIRWHACLF